MAFLSLKKSADSGTAGRSPLFALRCGLGVAFDGVNEWAPGRNSKALAPALSLVADEGLSGPESVGGMAGPVGMRRSAGSG